MSFGGGGVSTPEARNLTRELQQTFQGYRETAPGYLRLEQRYQPQYGQLALRNAAQQLQGYTDASGRHVPGTAELQRAANTYTRAGNVADATNLGPAASQAILRSNPYLAGAFNNMYQRTNNTPLLNILNAQARAGLESGGQLSNQDVRSLREQTGSEFARRGNLYGNQSLAADLLSRDAAVRARLAAAQAQAGTVQGMNQQQADYVGRAAQIFGTQLNPLAVLGLAGTGTGTSSGTSQQIGTGAQLFNPTNPYAADVYNTNYNAQAAANIANSNQNAARNAALISAAGSIAGGLLSDRRLKTDVHKVGVSPSGIPIKTWRYKTDPKRRKYVGAMAQDVEKVHPAAVRTDPVSGVKFLDPNRTDVAFGLVNKRK